MANVLTVDAGEHAGRELRDPGRHLVMWLAPLMVWYFNRGERHKWSLPEIRGYARKHPEGNNSDYGYINLVRTHAWLAVMLAPFAIGIPIGMTTPADRGAPLSGIFAVCTAVSMFGAGMSLQSGWRWGLADYCDYRLDRTQSRTRTRDGRPVGRWWARLLPLCVPTWGDPVFGLIFALLFTPAILSGAA